MKYSKPQVYTYRMAVVGGLASHRGADSKSVTGKNKGKGK
jgi:hypothetical protein